MPRASARAAYAAFISHAKTDEKKANEIAAALEKRGIKCWIAPRDVRPGYAYGDEIVRGIEKSRAFILVLSKASNGSAFVAREVERAVSKGKAVYAMRIEDVQPSPSLELFISGTQWIDAWSGGLSQHIDSLAKLLRKKKGAQPATAAAESEAEPPPPARKLPLAWLLGGGAVAIAALAAALFILKPFGGPGSSAASADDPNYQACAKLSGDAAITFCGLAITSGKFAGKDLAALHLNRGYERDAKGDNEGALADYSSAIEIQPSYALAYYNRGGIYRRLGKLDLALEDLNASIGYNAKDPDAFNRRGLIFVDRKDFDSALKDYNDAVKLDAKHINALTNRGALFAETGKNDLAVADFLKVLLLNPDDATRRRAVTALSDLGISTVDKVTDTDYQGCEKLSGIAAIAACDRAIAGKGFGGRDLSEIYRMRGWERRRKGDVADAMDDYTQAIEIDPTNAQAYHNRADAFYALNDLGRALEDYNSAIRLKEDTARVFWGRGRTYQAKGDYRLAREDYNKALSLKPEQSVKELIVGALAKLDESQAATVSGNGAAANPTPSVPPSGTETSADK